MEAIIRIEAHCDTTPLETSVTEHMLSNHYGELGLGQEMNLELLLCQLVDLDIDSFSVTQLAIDLCMSNTNSTTLGNLF